MRLFFSEPLAKKIARTSYNRGVVVLIHNAQWSRSEAPNPFRPGITRPIIAPVVR